MSFTNPFAQFGSYRRDGTPETENTEEKLVSTGYLTCAPDISQISSEQATMLLRQLLKRHARTKQRALTELASYFAANEIDDALHLAYIQIYAKIALDVSPEVRAESHETLKALYTKLGKRSAKYLKYSAPIWVIARFDGDVQVVESARRTFDAVFPTSEKQNAVLDKLRPAFVEFVFDSCMYATAATLSDLRLVSEEEARQKYTRLVGGCLQLLVEEPRFFSTSDDLTNQLIDSGRLWKFFRSNDYELANAALRLAGIHADELEAHASEIWREMLRGSEGVALQLLTQMTLYTKKFPEQTWTHEEEPRRAGVAALARLASSQMLQPPRFWPLLYNLALMIPEPPNRDLKPLFKPLEKAALRARNDAQLMEPVWGCFISLASKMGEEGLKQLLATIANKLVRPSASTCKTVAKFLTRIADDETVRKLVSAQLVGGKVPLHYIIILAQTTKFKQDIETHALRNDSPVELVAAVVSADPTIKLPENLEISGDPHWLDVALTSTKCNRQHIVDVVKQAGFELEVLRNAPALSKLGVTENLNEFVESHQNDADVCTAAAAAAESGFVSVDLASAVFAKAVRQTLAGKGDAKALIRFVRQHEKVVAKIANEGDLRSDLESLAFEDDSGVVSRVLGLNLSDKGGSSINKQRSLSSIILEELDFGFPAEFEVNGLRAVPPNFKNEESTISDVLSLCENLPRDCRGPDDAAKVAILKAYFDGWALAAPANQFEKLATWLDGAVAAQCSEGNETELSYKLWEYTASSNHSLACLAAVALVQNNLLVPSEFDLQNFKNGSYRGAAQANLEVINDCEEYTRMQASLVRRALTGNVDPWEYKYIDKRYVPSSCELTLKNDDRCVVQRLLTFSGHIRNAGDLAFGTGVTAWAALCAVDSVNDITTLLQFAERLPVRTGVDRMKLLKCVELVNRYLTEHEVSTSAAEGILKSPSTFFEKPWIALQIWRYSHLVNGNDGSNSALNKHSNDYDLSDADSEGLSDEEDEDAAESSESKVSASTESSSNCTAIVSNLILLNFTSNPTLSTSNTSVVLDFIAAHLSALANVRQTNPFEYVKLTSTPPPRERIAANLLYRLCALKPAAIGKWYRQQRERSVIQLFDSVLPGIVLPSLMHDFKEEFGRIDFFNGEEIVVNEKRHEIRARREVEDGVCVEIVFALGDHYPARPAHVEIRNLGSVSEAKRRHWVLEARQMLNAKGPQRALLSLLKRVNSYIDGVEPCAICYMRISDQKRLPNKQCAQCNNVYHTDCLYQWFSTNGNRLCPMCRSAM